MRIVKHLNAAMKARSIYERYNAAAELYREESEHRNAITIDFVRTEVDLAETFCALAANTSSPQKAERSRERALRALGGATHALSHVSMDERQRAAILRRIARIAKVLHNSGPGVGSRTAQGLRSKAASRRPLPECKTYVTETHYEL